MFRVPWHAIHSVMNDKGMCIRGRELVVCEAHINQVNNLDAMDYIA